MRSRIKADFERCRLDDFDNWMIIRMKSQVWGKSKAYHGMWYDACM